MPHEEPVISPEHPPSKTTPAPETAVQRGSDAAPHVRANRAQDEWLEEPDELPRRPRRRLLAPRAARAARRAADRVRVHRRRARREGPEHLELLDRRHGSSLASRFARAAREHVEHRRGRRLRRQLAMGRPERRLHATDRRPVAYVSGEHAVCDHLRRQHRQGHDLARHERDQDGQSEPSTGSTPVKRSPSRAPPARTAQSAPNRSASARAAAGSAALFGGSGASGTGAARAEPAARQRTGPVWGRLAIRSCSAGAARCATHEIIDKGAPCLTSTANRRKSRAAAARLLVLACARAGGVRRILEQLEQTHLDVRPARRHDLDGPAGPRDRAPGASKRCANACRRTGSHCPNAHPASDQAARAASSAGPAAPSCRAGVTRAQYEAALKKCGGVRAASPAAVRRFSSPAFKQALAKFATCMRSERRQRARTQHLRQQARSSTPKD